ncbi:unnamed protein product [Cylindrotheca closterium]|uniref:Uncharacterized protein n=1 Tax=Cylindrotheca closterium TaxID=2856 RepID=A0AAD2FXJ0_9STRA|nr:unnamed protein product [Cylindrotheca closterium]
MPNTDSNYSCSALPVHQQSLSNQRSAPMNDESLLRFLSPFPPPPPLPPVTMPLDGRTSETGTKDLIAILDEVLELIYFEDATSELNDPCFRLPLDPQ